MITVNIQNLQKKIPFSRRKIAQTVLKIIAREKLPKAAEVSVSLITDRRIRRLNRLYHGRDLPTDVLAFDLGGGKKELIADIYISTDTALRNSKTFKTEPLGELYLYVIHGMLHLAGYDDHKPADIKRMRAKEQEYLK